MRAVILLAVACVASVACGSGDMQNAASTTPTTSVAPPATSTSMSSSSPIATVSVPLSYEQPCVTENLVMEHRFNFTIPAEVTTLPEAIDYVREFEQMRPPHCQLVETTDTEITAGVMGAGIIPPKFIVRVWGETLEDALQLKTEWGAEFRRVFDRWDPCQIDVGWELSHRNSDGSSTDYDLPNDNYATNDYYISPGCEYPVVSEEDRYPERR
jgi:hypothetical protein